MIDLIVLAAGLPGLDDQALLAAHRGKPLYRHSFEAARQTADAMLGLRVTVVTRPGVLDEAIREFGFNKVVVSANRPLSQAVIAGAKAARSGASRCFLPCGRPEVTGGRLTEFLQGYILSGRPLGRMGEGDATVFAPYLLPQLLALRGAGDGAALFQGAAVLTRHALAHGADIGFGLVGPVGNADAAREVDEGQRHAALVHQLAPGLEQKPCQRGIIGGVGGVAAQKGVQAEARGSKVPKAQKRLA